MKKVIVFGNSASGKSTLAKKLSALEQLAHLDLDTLAWQQSVVPTRRSTAQSSSDIAVFTAANDNWVIEGCYADLLAMVLPQATDIFFMDLSIERCISNAKNRPWEPHKYASKAAQDENLAMLIDWISLYTLRDDEFSYGAHAALFENFQGNKHRYSMNE